VEPSKATSAGVPARVQPCPSRHGALLVSANLQRRAPTCHGTICDVAPRTGRRSSLHAGCSTESNEPRCGSHRTLHTAFPFHTRSASGRSTSSHATRTWCACPSRVQCSPAPGTSIVCFVSLRTKWSTCCGYAGGGGATDEGVRDPRNIDSRGTCQAGESVGWTHHYTC